MAKDPAPRLWKHVVNLKHWSWLDANGPQED